MLAGCVVHTKTQLGDERFAVTTASGPLREALTDPDDPLAQRFGLPPHTIVLMKGEVSGDWFRA